MASIALGVVGAGIGAFFGGPQGAMLGWSAGVTLAGIVFPPKQQNQQRGKLDDLRVTGSGYGAVIPQVYGKARVGGNIIWAADLVERKRSQTAGGKGTGGPKVTTYSYFANFAIGICTGPISKVLRIWADDLLIYDDSQTPKSKYDVTVYTGSETQTADPLMESYLGAGNVPAYRGTAYVVFNALPLVKFGNRIPNLNFEIDSGAQTIGSILAALFAQVNLSSTQYNVALATQAIIGFVVASRESVKSLIDPMLQVFGVDVAEFDGKINALPRGGAVDLTIPAGDMGAVMDNAGSGFMMDDFSTLDVKRIQDLELPATCELTYFASTKNYQTGSQRAVRFTKANVAEPLTVNTPLVMDDNTARQRAEYVLYDQWIAREQAHIILSPSYLRLVPGSILNVPVGTGVMRARVVSMDLAPFGPLDITLVRDDVNVLTQLIAGGSLGTVTDTLTNPDTIAFIPFCCNALRDVDADSIGFYMVAAGQPGWEGVQVYKSNGGNAYRELDRINDTADFGLTLSVLPAGTSTGTIDYGYTLDVRMQAGTLGTVSMDDLLSGANAAIVGDATLGYELIQFLTATALNATDYRLSGFRRGLRGTDAFWTGHLTGQNFVVISAGNVHRVDVDRSLIGKTINLKAILDKQVLADVTPTALTITGQELKPYSPVQITGARDGSNNLTINWIRRARKNFELQDLSDVELDEPVEAYEVDILNALGTAVLRTIGGLATPTASYTAAQQVTDFGSTQPAIKVNVYQLGDFKTGTTTSRMRGYPGSVTV